MADTKYTRYIQTFPKTFRPQDGDEVLNNIPAVDRAGMTIAELWNANVANPILNAVLRGFAEADDTIAEQIQQTKATLFVRTAQNQYLDVIASSLGVSRPASLGISDTAFQNLVPPLSLGAKQVRQAFYNAMDAFYGEEFSRANLITLSNAPFDLQFSVTTDNPQIVDTINFAVDAGTIQSALVRSTDLVTSGAMTALELNTFINGNFTGITSEVLTDPITKEETIRIRTNSPGIRGALDYTSSRLSTFTRTDLITANDTNTQTITVSVTGQYQTNDIITLSNALTFIIQDVQEVSGTSLLLLNDLTTGITANTDSITTQVRTENIPIFSTERAEIIKQAQRTAIYEVNNNEVVIELPAVIPTLERGLKGSLHVHNGPLTNILINTADLAEYQLPSNLFSNATTTSTVLIQTSAVDANIRSLTIPDHLQFRVGDVLTIRDQTTGIVKTGDFIIQSINTTTNVLVLLDSFTNLIAGDIITVISRPDTYLITSTETWFSYEINSNPLDIGQVENDKRKVFLQPPAAQDIDVYDFIVSNPNKTTLTVDITSVPNGVLTINGEVIFLPALNTNDTIDTYISNLISQIIIQIPTITGITRSGSNVVFDGPTVELTGTISNLVLTYTESFRFFVRLQDPLNLPTDAQIWEGAFIFDPTGSETQFIVTGESAIITGDADTGQDTLAAGRVFPRVNVEADTNTLPTTSGLAVIGYGSESQEPALIRYRGRAADDVIELDPSFVFTNNQPRGTYINIVQSATPFIPDRFGGAYPIYLTSNLEARATVQSLLESLAAAGVTLTFVVLTPEYTYLIDNPYVDTDDAPLV